MGWAAGRRRRAKDNSDELFYFVPLYWGLRNLFIHALVLITAHGSLDKYKAFISAANGASGTLTNDGAVRMISTPLIGDPGVGTTQTFLTVGAFDTSDEAEAVLKYIYTKFVRALLGVLKVTQHITSPKWKYVPLQDFTPASDIDWTKSVADIDRQLYKKYGLDEAEIDFIEMHVKEMK